MLPPDPSEVTPGTPSDSPGARLIRRVRHLAAVERLLAELPVVGLIGARQVGKTTLAREFAANQVGAPPVAGEDVARDSASRLPLGEERRIRRRSAIHKRARIWPGRDRAREAADALPPVRVY